MFSRFSASGFQSRISALKIRHAQPSNYFKTSALSRFAGTEEGFSSPARFGARRGILYFDKKGLMHVASVFECCRLFFIEADNLSCNLQFNEYKFLLALNKYVGLKL